MQHLSLQVRRVITQVRHSRAAAKVTALYAMVFMALVTMTTTTYAQGTGGGAGTGTLSAKFTELTTNLSTLGRPMAGLSFIIFLLSVVFEPALPGWAQENKRVVRGSMIGAMLLGAAPDIVNFFVA